LRWAQEGQAFGLDQDFDTASQIRIPADQAYPFQGQHHLVNGRRAHPKVALNFGLSRRAAMHPRIGIGEGQVLVLSIGEAFLGHPPHGWFICRSCNGEAQMNIVGPEQPKTD
jgi:hypothetical protein